MRYATALWMVMAMLPNSAEAATKSHVLSFGKWTSVSWSVDAGKPLVLKIRGLYVDGRIKEFTFGVPHEVTERLYVVRRAFRVNDALPDDAAPRWEWQPGGWLLVDRVTGHVTQIALPEFDPYYSAASWYRDYIAYCGISDDGKKLLGAVSQLGRRKVILKKSLGEIKAADADADDAVAANCFTPTWQRQPVRVTFQVKGAATATYAIRGHAAEMVVEQNESAESNGEDAGDEDKEDKATE